MLQRAGTQGAETPEFPALPCEGSVAKYGAFLPRSSCWIRIGSSLHHVTLPRFVLFGGAAPDPDVLSPDSLALFSASPAGTPQRHVLCTLGFAQGEPQPTADSISGTSLQVQTPLIPLSSQLIFLCFRKVCSPFSFPPPFLHIASLVMRSLCAP